ncbi:sialate O-acetylesterase [Rufibacter aurantiacus]|uniref:sialate O-acetylesterase n=1 Tax=Rufibacter aurantiacus TaxID=2817374 RepID=UPI001FEE720F|nr:sialate O-acetylesterase [Rufibacter aurantiacus]
MSRRNMFRGKVKFIVALLCLFQAEAYSQVRLPKLVSDGMVLQRDAKTNIWGWAAPGEKVTVTFRGKNYKATTNPSGKWQVALSPVKAGGPYTMDIKGSNQITVKDILLGDVYFCSGQSNMVHQMSLHNITYANDIITANYPQIRHFWIPTTANMEGPAQDLPAAAAWKWANPQDVNNFSAVAYFFARKLYDRYKIPIGLINASVGGTPIEAWTSEEGLKEFPAIMSTIDKNKDTSYVNPIQRRAAAVAAANRQKPELDKGLTGAVKWFDPAYVPKGWRNINIPGYWEDQGIRDLNGAVWYRREIEVPASMVGVPAKVFLGRIVDADFLYINGKQVGNTGYQYPQRRYSVPAGTLKAGKNLFVVRVLNQGGKGGFVPDKPYYLEANGQTLDLKGTWQYKVGDVYRPATGPFEGGISAQNQPTALYNAMVAPAINYTLKGILWYQGESNAGNPTEYKKLLPALIADWRAKWGQGNLPFLFVQLPNFMEANYLPTESNWALMREAALQTLSVPNTAMAVTIELGEWNDIHPDNKKDVGERLALAAMKLIYGDNKIVSSGPLYQSLKIERNKIILSFTNVGGGLISIDDEELSQFAIAGADKKFVWANAKIEGDKVVVWSDEVPEPKYVRYAWADNPDSANLYNKEKLPASPFRTDK